jgi:hypothetical protein
MRTNSAKYLLNPVLQAVRALGGSGSNDAIRDYIIQYGGFSAEDIAEKHQSVKQTSYDTALEYSAAWARTALKKSGYLENPLRSVWSLTDKAIDCVLSETQLRAVMQELATSNRATNAEKFEKDITAQTGLYLLYLGPTDPEVDGEDEIRYVLKFGKASGKHGLAGRIDDYKTYCWTREVLATWPGLENYETRILNMLEREFEEIERDEEKFAVPSKNYFKLIVDEITNYQKRLEAREIVRGDNKITVTKDVE